MVRKPKRQTTSPAMSNRTKWLVVISILVVVSMVLGVLLSTFAPSGAALPPPSSSLETPALTWTLTHLGGLL